MPATRSSLGKSLLLLLVPAPQFCLVPYLGVLVSTFRSVLPWAFQALQGKVGESG